jgi:hypothetical protein
LSTTGFRAAYALVDALEDHLGWLLTHGYSHATVRVRRFELRNLAAFLAELGIFDVGDVSFSALESTKIYTRVSVEKLRAVHQATHPAGK